MTALVALALVVPLFAGASPTWGTETPFDSPLLPPDDETWEPFPPPELPPEHRAVLVSVAETYNLPLDALRITNAHMRNYPTLDRTFQAFTIVVDLLDDYQELQLLIDSESGELIDDRWRIETDEMEAYRARYGRIHPTLWERLQEVDEETLLPVAVWLPIEPWSPVEQAEITDELIQRIPATEQALDDSGVPWMVEDEELRSKIRQEYLRVLVALVSTRVQPVVDEMANMGIAEITTLGGTPSVAGLATKADILALGSREDIDLVYLIDATPEPAMIESIVTNRPPIPWYTGNLSGAGRRIAILEPTTIQSTGCLTVVAQRFMHSFGYPDPNHKTRAASIAACNNSVRRGLAYDAQLLDVGLSDIPWLGNADFPHAVEWAINNDAEIINLSFSYETNWQMNWSDRVLDYWARTKRVVIAVAAGNNAPNVFSPAKGWNVLAVGAGNDNNTRKWTDDDMWSLSNWENPNSPNGDREKPDLVAPGQSITLIGPGGSLYTDSGTSFATPQVSGLAAVLINQNNELLDYPVSTKAIMMATAVHNVDGWRDMPTQSDLRDGAGSIQVGLATVVAANRGSTNTTCDQPCWWGNHNLSLASNGYIDRTFRALRGERIRVAIAWWGWVNSTPSTALRTNYNLEIRAPNGSSVVSSTSWDNSNELVDFIAPQTGVYTIRVRRHAGDNYSSETQNDLGIAWVRQSSYLPYIPTNNGWSGNVYVRNDGATLRDVYVRYSNGTQTTGAVAPNGWYNSTIPGDLQLSAVIDGDQDLTTVTRQINTNRSMLDNAFLNTTIGDWAFERAFSTLYGPAFYRNFFNINTNVYIQNVGTQSTHITVYFYGRSTYPDPPSHTFIDVAPNARVVLTPSHINPNPWVGSLRIVSSSSQPLTAKFMETRNDGSINIARSYNGAASGFPLIYAAAAYKNMWNFNTGLVIQNLHDTGFTNVTVRFCARNVQNPPTGCHDHIINNIGPRRAVGLNLSTVTALGSSWTGSISITSSNGRPLAATVNNDYFNASGTVIGGYNYSATATGGRYVYLPYAAKSAGGFTTGYTIRNISGQNNVNVVAYYYNRSGTLAWTSPTMLLHSAQSTGRFQADDGPGGALPNGWQGSIVLEATADIVAVMRADGLNTTSGYNGIVR